jgi:hypothetical protein
MAYTREVIRINQPQDLAGQDAWATTLVENKDVDDSVQFITPDFSGFANVNDVLITITVDLIRGKGTLTATIANSADGTNWAYPGVFAFNYDEMVRGGGVERVVVAAPLDIIRLGFTASPGTLWKIISVTAVLGVFETSGSGGGNMATDTLWNAKGDLAVASADNTGNILPLGPNGYVLTADPSQPLGIKWAPVVAAPVVGVANDTIWDSKGELAVGVGDNAAQRFLPGQNGEVLTTDLTTPQGLKWTTVTVGDYSLPPRLQPVGPTATDLNQVWQAGWYFFMPDAANSPFPGDYGKLLTPGCSALGQRCPQLAFSLYYDRVAFRYSGAPGAAGGWRQIYPIDDQGLPARIGLVGLQVTDFNTATSNGWYWGQSAANAPVAGNYVAVRVDALNSAVDVQQEAWVYNDASMAQYRRRLFNSSWGAWVQTWPVAGTPGYGTSLPASPINGQETILVDNTSNPSYVWRFRYNNGSTSPYKWEFIGGSGYAAVVQAGFTGTWSIGDYTYHDGGGPTLTVPRSGDYDIVSQAQISSARNQGGAYNAALMSYDIGATAAVDSDAVASMASSDPGVQSQFDALPHQYRLNRKTFGAGTVLTAKYRHANYADAGMPQFQHRAIAITPIRVS